MAMTVWDRLKQWRRWLAPSIRRLWAQQPWVQQRWLRQGLPWGLAAVIHLCAGLLLLTVPFLQFGRGLPDAERVVSVFVVPPPEPAPALTPVPQSDEDRRHTDDQNAVAIAPAEDPETPPQTLDEDPTPEAIVPPPPQPSRRAQPVIELPSAEVGQGRRDGLVALDCGQHFLDPDKAAECAGREVRSGWKLSVEAIGEDWDRIADEMRRGGYEAPSYGPDPLASMGEGTRVFEGEDVRFRNREFDQWSRYTRSFNSPQERREYRRLQDPRRYIGEGDAVRSGYGLGETVPISGWQPSWQLRDDPNIDRRELDALAREAND